MIITTTGCHSRQEPKVDITPHHINLQADSFYQQAMTLMESSYDVDSTRKCIRFLDKALAIDSLNPDYYGIKAKLLSEMGELDSALHVQTLAMKKKAITGEYLFQDYFRLPKTCTPKLTKVSAKAEPFFRRY